MMEVFSALFAPIVYLFIMALVVSTVMFAFVETFNILWAAINWFKGFFP